MKKIIDMTVLSIKLSKNTKFKDTQRSKEEHASGKQVPSNKIQLDIEELGKGTYNSIADMLTLHPFCTNPYIWEWSVSISYAGLWEWQSFSQYVPQFYHTQYIPWNMHMVLIGFVSVIS